MALQIKEGDLLAEVSGKAIIVHGCNCRGKMKSGFAEKLRNKYPDAYTAYKRTERQKGLQLGEVSTVMYQNGMIICNAMTQDRYGRDSSIVYVNYEAVEKALSKAAEFAEKNDYPVHLPLIGGGLANGDKEKLLSIFKRVFVNTNATLWRLPKDKLTGEKIEI